MSGTGRAGGGGYDAAQRSVLDGLLRAGAPLRCPACGAEVARRAIEPPPEVSYVRHRVLLVCTGCHRSGGFDLPPDGLSAAAPP